MMLAAFVYHTPQEKGVGDCCFIGRYCVEDWEKLMVKIGTMSNDSCLLVLDGQIVENKKFGKS
jgi:hypothetical protein